MPFDDKQQRGQFVWQEGLLFNTMPNYFVAIVSFDDKQQRGQFMEQEGLLFNAVPTAASTIQAAAVLHPADYTIYP